MKHSAKFLGAAAVVIGLGFSGTTAIFAAGAPHGSGMSSGGGYHGGSYGGHYEGGRGAYYGGYHGGYYGGYGGGWYGGYLWPFAFSYSYPVVPYYYSSSAVVYSAPPVVYRSPPVVYNAPNPATAVYSSSAPAPVAQSSPPAQQGNPRPSKDVADIKALVQAKIGDEVIISQIRNSHTVYHLRASEIIELKNSGVSEKVIDFMINTATP